MCSKLGLLSLYVPLSIDSKTRFAIYRSQPGRFEMCHRRTVRVMYREANEQTRAR